MASQEFNIDDLVNDELSKFSDMNIILQKLQEKGYYSQLMEIFLKIFKEESEFTLSELEKIARQKPHEIDLLEQFWINSDIFRTNFCLILRSMGKPFVDPPSQHYMEE